MRRGVYRYVLERNISLSEARESLLLAIYSAEGIHGRAQVRLDAGYSVDEQENALVVDASTPVGRTVAQIFTGLVAREFGEDSFTVEHVSEPARKGEGSP